MNLYNDIIDKLSYFRVQKNLSAREVGLRMGKSESWFYRVENKEIKLNLKNLLNLLDVLGISAFELFYYDVRKLNEDIEIQNNIKKLDLNKKQAVNNFIKELIKN